MKTFRWVLKSAITIILFSSCSKCEYDFENRAPLNFSQVLELGIEGCMKYYYVPGCAWAVLNEEGITTGTAGNTIYGSVSKIDISHRFQIGSLGKSYTALMAAKCVEEGLISWETELFSIFPHWRDDAQPEYENLTLSDLLSHRTNLQPLNVHKTHVDKKTGKLVYENIPNFDGTDFERRRMFCQYALSLNPVNTEGVNYGNSGYVLAGCMIEEVTGKTWENLALELAADLDIEIGFERPNRIDPNQPWGHLLVNNNCLEPISPDDPKVYNDPLFSPAGNINVNIIDFSKYVIQFMKGLKNVDGTVMAESFKYLLMGKEPYSMGWYNDFESESIFYHYGSEGTFSCHMMIFDNLNSAIIIFTNAPNHDNTNNFINDSRNYLKQKYIYNAV